MTVSVTVILYANLKTGRFSQADVEMPADSRVIDLLAHLGIDEGELGVLMVNGRAGSLKQKIKEKDKVTIIPPIGGG